MAQFSTGLRNGVLGTNPLKTLLAGGQINIYSGPVPASADAAVDAVNNVLLATIKNGTAGINFDPPSGDLLQKAAAETWSGVNAATGTATFFRHILSTDDAAASTAEVRIQGTVNTTGADLNLSSTALVSGATQTIDYYAVALPTL